MTEPWWELRLAVPEFLADDAGALLISEGALGVEELSAKTPPPKLPGGSEPPPLPGPETSVLLASYDGALEEMEVAARARAALDELEGDLPFSLTRRADTDWAERWKQYWKPMRFGERLWVVPSWERDFAAPKDALLIEVDPGLAFGTGQHATTALCLEVLDSHFRPGETALDVGAGSGVLAIAAARLGAGPTLAIDNDPLAVRVTAENIDINGVGKLVSSTGDDVTALTTSYDWCIANIIAPVLIELAPALVARTKPLGVLLLSGILREQADDVTAAIQSSARAAGRREPVALDRRDRENWVALAYRI